MTPESPRRSWKNSEDLERNCDMLPIRLSPDKDLRVESIRIGNVPTLILRPAKIKPVSVGVL